MKLLDNKSYSKKMKSQKFTILSIVLILIVSLIGIASAEFWYCANDGERINYCNPKIPDRTCESSLGCKYCMSDSSTSTCFNSGNWMKCNANAPNCEFNNGGPDSTPLNFSIDDPDNNAIYNTRAIMFNLRSNKDASYYWIDNINGRGRWNRLGSRLKLFSKKVSFKDGLNDITIKAVASNGEEILFARSFYVDSKKPQIKKTWPTKDFTSGNFGVEFSEENPKSLVLKYGNSAKGIKTRNVNIAAECVLDKKKYSCDLNVNVNEFNGQSIEYWFELTDIANTKAESKHVWIEVDTQLPIINNPNSFYNQTGKSVYFKINITEKNFDEITYFDNAQRKPVAKKLCTKLKDGLCEKKVTFNKGYHDVDIQVIDEAGNSIALNIKFDVV